MTTDDHNHHHSPTSHTTLHPRTQPRHVDRPPHRQPGDREFQRWMQTTPVVDPTDPETGLPTHIEYDGPANVGYRLGGRGATRVLIAPNGQVVSDPARTITVQEPGRAWTIVGTKTTTVRWQPDLREVDAYDRQHDPRAARLPADDLRDVAEGETDAETTATTPIRGAGPDGEPLAASDATRRSHTTPTTASHTPRWRPYLPWWTLPVGIIVLLLLMAMHQSWEAGMLHL